LAKKVGKKTSAKANPSPKKKLNLLQKARKRQKKTKPLIELKQIV